MFIHSQLNISLTDLDSENKKSIYVILNDRIGKMPTHEGYIALSTVEEEGQLVVLTCVRGSKMGWNGQ